MKDHDAVIFIFPIQKSDIDELGQKQKQIGAQNQRRWVDDEGPFSSETGGDSFLFRGQGLTFIHGVLWLLHWKKGSPFR